MTSEVAAPNKMWELSLYELHRTPQEAITDDTEIAVSPRSLHSELMCPICLDMLKNTMTTKECLHRFCQECIITALRSGNKECPTCRKKLVSKRSLRPDPNFDALISKIYPSRDEYEAHQEKLIAKLNKHHNPNALSTSIEEGLRLQALNRAQRVKKLNTNITAENRKAEDEQQNADVGNIPELKEDNIDDISNSSNDYYNKKLSVKPFSEDSYAENSTEADLSEFNLKKGDSPEPVVPKLNYEVELMFRPYPSNTDVDPLQTRYLKTTSNATG